MVAPVVSVILPAYNASRYVRDAVESILSQTLTECELIIIDDGSTDGTAEIVDSYSCDDRVRIIHLPENGGLVAALNQGIDLARGKYAARMDADDVSHPERLRKQVAYMEGHPDCGICGTWFRYLGSGETVERPVSADAIRRHLVFDTPFCHPSVMMRLDILRRMPIRYRPDYRHCEDYELWSRLLFETNGYNIPECLLDYRSSATQITSKHARVNAELSDRIRTELLWRVYAVRTSGDDVQIACSILRGGPSSVGRKQELDFVRRSLLNSGNLRFKIMLMRRILYALQGK